jgi:CRP-like cAMP-binding protein
MQTIHNPLDKNSLNDGRLSSSSLGSKPLASQQSPSQNHILAALSKPELARMTARTQLVELKLGDAVYQPDQPMHYAYFPTTSIISLQYVTEAGASAEAASVGNEGMVGVPLFLGGNTTSSSAVVQMAGYAYRLESSILKAEFNCAGVMQRLLLRYVQVLMTQMFQTAICNRHHSVEQQLARWLLLTVDRVATNELIMTQELVANMLGVRRESITQAASNLQSANCIRYRRGHISVVDRKKLEHRVCECYDVVKKELNRLMA